ncbi:hypothetical protein PYW07_011466 [Mythimna separata]|uniref:Uncharacterized protein n=1 Tax=Mythimna separata TaxID=271217 RepID=A0AAD8DM30_MYTSE|nr:hypothetical protein PYW07_011466 [Mythimna separata]
MQGKTRARLYHTQKSNTPMTRCDYDVVFYRVFCVTLLAVAFTFTVILTNVFVDIDGMLTRRQDSTRFNDKHIRDEFTTEAADNDDLNYGEGEDSYRTKRSIETQSFLFHIKNPKVKNILANRLSTLLEELEAEETAVIKPIEKKNGEDIPKVDAKPKLAEEDIKEKQLHTNMHNILLQGIQNHMDLNDVFKRMYSLLSNFNQMNDRKDGLRNKPIETEKEKEDIKLQKPIEDSFFDEMINCNQLQDQIQTTTVKPAKANVVIKTVIDITSIDNDKFKENNTKISNENIQGDVELVYNGKVVKFVNSATETEKPVTKKKIPLAFKPRRHTTETTTTEDYNMIPKSYMNKFVEEYFKHFPHDTKDNNEINRHFQTKRLKRHVRIKYENSGETKSKSKKNTEEDELYVEIETHFDSKGMKGEKKKKLIKTLIKKIQNAIHSDITKANLTGKQAPISKTLPLKQAKSPLIETKSGEEWRKPNFGPGFLASGKEINSAEMNQVNIDYSKILEVNGIPQRLQQPLNTELSEETIKTNSYYDMGKMKFVIKDIDGSGFSVGFNQYVDEPPDPESMRLFAGLENVIKTYHQAYDQAPEPTTTTEANLEDDAGPIELPNNEHNIERRSINKPNDYHSNEYSDIFNKDFLVYKDYRDIYKGSTKPRHKYIRKKNKKPPLVLDDNIFEKPLKPAEILSLANLFERKKRSINVKKMSNLNTRLKYNKFLNTNAMAKTIYLNTKRNKRQINKIRIIASDLPRMSKQSDENMYVVSDENIFADRAIIKEVDSSEDHEKREESEIFSYQNDEPSPYITKIFDGRSRRNPLMSKYPHIFMEEVSRSREQYIPNNSLLFGKLGFGKANPEPEIINNDDKTDIEQFMSSTFNDTDPSKPFQDRDYVSSLISPPNNSNYKVTLKSPNELVYKVQEDKDGKSLTISSPNLKKSLREIIYYHIIEKPFGKVRDDGEDLSDEKESPFGEAPKSEEPEHTFTNGQGFQFPASDEDLVEPEEAVPDGPKLELDKPIQDDSGVSEDNGSNAIKESDPADITTDAPKESEEPADKDNPENSPKNRTKREVSENDKTPDDTKLNSFKVKAPQKEKARNQPKQYGMDLHGNGGTVWSNLNYPHVSYHVGYVDSNEVSTEFNSDSSSDENSSSDSSQSSSQSDSGSSDSNSATDDVISSFASKESPETPVSGESGEAGIASSSDENSHESGENDTSKSGDSSEGNGSVTNVSSGSGESKSGSGENSSNSVENDSHSGENGSDSGESGSNSGENGSDSGENGSNSGQNGNNSAENASNPGQNSGETGNNNQKPVENGKDKNTGNNATANDIINKFSQILTDLHDIFVKGNATIVVPKPDKDTANNVDLPGMLDHIFSDVTSENEILRPGVEVNGDPNNPNMVNVLEGLFTKIIKNNIVINNNVPVSEQPVDINAKKDKTESTTTEKSKIDEDRPSVTDAGEDNNELPHITEEENPATTAPEEDRHSNGIDETPNVNTPDEILPNKDEKENPIENNTSSPDQPKTDGDLGNTTDDHENPDVHANETNEPTSEISNDEKPEESGDNELPDNHVNETDEPTTELSNHDQPEETSDHENPDNQAIETDEPTTVANYHDEPEVTGSHEPAIETPVEIHNNGEVSKLPEEDHTKEPEEVTKEPIEEVKEEKCPVQNKDNSEAEKNTKMDYALDLINNRTTKFIKEEIAAQVKKYFEEHPIVSKEPATNVEKDPTTDNKGGNNNDKPVIVKAVVTKPNSSNKGTNEPISKEKDPLEPNSTENNGNDSVNDEKNMNEPDNHKDDQNELNIKPTEQPIGSNHDEITTEKPKKEPSVQVKANTVYGNTVGNDKVTNVYIFYASKNMDEIMKNIKNLVNGNNSTNIFTFGPHKPKPGHKNKGNNEKENHKPTELPKVTEVATGPNVSDVTEETNIETGNHGIESSTEPNNNDDNVTGKDDNRDSSGEGYSTETNKGNTPEEPNVTTESNTDSTPTTEDQTELNKEKTDGGDNGNITGLGSDIVSENESKPEEPKDHTDEDHSGEPKVNSGETNHSEEPNVNPEEPEVNPEEPKVNPEEPKVNSEEPNVNPEEPKVNSGETNHSEEPTVNLEEPKVNSEKPKVNSGESDHPEEPKVNSEEPRVNSGETDHPEEPKANLEEPKVNSEEPKVNSGESDHPEEPKVNSEEPRVNSGETDHPEEPKANLAEPKVNSEEPKVNSGETDHPEEPKVNLEEPKVNSEEPIVNSEEPAVNSEEPVVNSDETDHPKEPKVNPEEPKVNPEEPKVNSGETNPSEEPKVNSGETNHSKEPKVNSGEANHTEEPKVNSGETKPSEEPKVNSGATNPSEEPKVNSGETNHSEEPEVNSGEVNNSGGPKVNSEEPKLNSGEVTNSEKPKVNSGEVTNSEEPKVNSEEPKVNSEKPKVNSGEVTNSEEPIVNSEEPKVNSEEPKVDSGEVTNSEEPKVNSEEPKVNSEKPKVNSGEVTNSEEPKVNSEEPKVNSGEPKNSGDINNSEQPEVNTGGINNSEEPKVNSAEINNSGEPKVSSGEINNSGEPKVNSEEPKVNSGEVNNSGEHKVNSGENHSAEPKVNSEEPKVNSKEPKVNSGEHSEEPKVNSGETKHSEEPNINSGEPKVNSGEVNNSEPPKVNSGEDHSAEAKVNSGETQANSGENNASSEKVVSGVNDASGEPKVNSGENNASGEKIASGEKDASSEPKVNSGENNASSEKQASKETSSDKDASRENIASNEKVTSGDKDTSAEPRDQSGEKNASGEKLLDLFGAPSEALSQL